MDLLFGSPLQKQAATQNEAALLVGSGCESNGR
jgi:hypothetical protein